MLLVPKNTTLAPPCSPSSFIPRFETYRVFCGLSALGQTDRQTSDAGFLLFVPVCAVGKLDMFRDVATRHAIYSAPYAAMSLGSDVFSSFWEIGRLSRQSTLSAQVGVSEGIMCAIVEVIHFSFPTIE